MSSNTVDIDFFDGVDIGVDGAISLGIASNAKADADAVAEGSGCGC